jgi:two-component system phosphate regulon sensor histidine kinase PhoR
LPFRFRRQGAAPAAAETGAEVAEVPGPASPWPAAALAGLGRPWLRVDALLRVVEASAEAVELFDAEPPPRSLIDFCRTAAIEERVRAALAGEPCDLEIEAPHYRRWLRLRALPLGPAGAFVLLEDSTELRRLEAVRADFVTNLAHELRTPVASLSLAVETLQADLPSDERRRFVQRVAEETRYIEGLLRTVTELAVLEGRVRLSEEAFGLAEVVEESWLRVTARQGEAPLLSLVAPEMVVVADRIRVAEVLQNLLENAHRFSPEGQPVEVSATRREAVVEVMVRDHGPGIPPTDLPRIFERFYKVDRARTRRGEAGGEGTGLGLAIARHLVVAHGGRIWAEAAAGGGTAFLFELPARD